MGDNIAISDEANAALQEWMDARKNWNDCGCEGRFRDAETTLSWMTQDPTHFRQSSDFDLKDFNALEDAYAMAYNDGHRDGRNRAAYAPSVVKIDRETFREAYKMRAEDSFEAQRQPPWSAANPMPNRIIECGECDAKGVVQGRECSKCDGVGFWKIMSPKCAICDDWIAGRVGAECDECNKWYCDAHYDIDNNSCVVCGDPMTDSQSMMKHSEDHANELAIIGEKCDNERSFLISILSDRQLDEFLEFEEDSYSAETKLGKDSCCCGATKTNPCQCMVEGLKCSSTCPCSCGQKNAESDSEVCWKCIHSSTPHPPGSARECNVCHTHKPATAFTREDAKEVVEQYSSGYEHYCDACDIEMESWEDLKAGGHDLELLGPDAPRYGRWYGKREYKCKICEETYRSRHFDPSEDHTWDPILSCPGSPIPDHGQCPECKAQIDHLVESMNYSCPECGEELEESDSHREDRPWDEFGKTLDPRYQAESFDSEWNCVLCGHKSKGYGHNPDPVALTGRCCDTCNARIVIPNRMMHQHMWQRKKADYIVDVGGPYGAHYTGTIKEVKKAEEGCSCPVCGTNTEVIREHFDDDTSWVDLVVCDNCCWMEELEDNEEAYDDYMKHLIAMLDEEPDADLLEKPNVEVDTSWDWSDGVGPPPSQQTLDITYDAEGDDCPNPLCKHVPYEEYYIGWSARPYDPEEWKGKEKPETHMSSCGCFPCVNCDQLQRQQDMETKTCIHCGHSNRANSKAYENSLWGAEGEPNCASCNNPIPKDEYGEPDDVGDGTGRGSCCACVYCYEEMCSGDCDAKSIYHAEGDELTDEEKQEGWNIFQEEAASIEDPNLEKIKALADKHLTDIISDDSPMFFVDPGLEDYYQFILTDPTYSDGGEPEDAETAAMFEELKQVRYWATILTDRHIQEADNAAKAMIAAAIMSEDKELFDQGMLGLETNNQVQRERELLAQWLAEGGVHGN